MRFPSKSVRPFHPPCTGSSNVSHLVALILASSDTAQLPMCIVMVFYKCEVYESSKALWRCAQNSSPTAYIFGRKGTIRRMRGMTMPCSRVEHEVQPLLQIYP